MVATPPPESPDLAGVIAAANQVGLPYVIIGGFAVIANQYVRGTEDVDLLIKGDRSLDDLVVQFLSAIDAHRGGAPIGPDALKDAEALRIDTRVGPVDLLREGEPPLDFETVSKAAINLTFHGEHASVASLASVVAFKRLAGRPRDQLDLAELERIHGELPIQPIPGLDS